jgi:hypothetical protein
MKTAFKPLGLAAAVAAATAGYTGAVSAQEGVVSNRAVGDLGIIPYYTVNEGFATAIHIMNTTESTQVVKLRARRGSDSMDSLDFNLVLSPKDVWVASMSQKDDGNIVITSNDNSCAAPKGNPTANGGQEWVMPDQENIDTLIDFRVGAEEGYIEVIGMAETIDEAQPIAVAAKHVAGVPRDCEAVRSNFFRVEGAQVPGYVPGTNPVKGVHSPSVTAQTCSEGDTACGAVLPGLALNTYVETQDDAFKVSWAITDGNAGLEVGSNAVHIQGFASLPMMTNQQVILANNQDTLGYLFPDLDGGSPLFGARGLFDGEVRPLLGASSIQNDWSSRDSGSFAVATDWVVTMPGQYLMVDGRVEGYVRSLEDPNSPLYAPCLPNVCDQRDIPVGLNITYYDREEGEFTPEEGGLVVSPAINVTPDGIALLYEVNVIEWAVGADEVLKSQYGVAFKPLFEEDRGWADLAVVPSTIKSQGVWNWETESFDAVNNVSVPIVGFAAWERQFEASPEANYGRAIDHSYGSALPPVTPN